MPLLNTSEEEQIAPEQEQAEMPEEETAEGENQEESQGQLTVTAEQVGAEVMKQLDQNQQSVVKQIVNAGMKLLFDKETHNALFDSIRPEDEVPLADELGSGATNLMLMMHQKSKGSMPPEAIIPAGAILLAKACEFIDQSGMAPIDDQTYSDAMELFTVAIQDKLNPNFRQENGLEPRQEQAQGDQQTGQMNQPANNQALLNQGVA